MTPEQIRAHAEKNKLPLPRELQQGKTLCEIFTPTPAPRRGRMNKTEADYDRILTAMQQRNETLRHEFEPFTLRWGEDDTTGVKMRYTPDFLVIRDHGRNWLGRKLPATGAMKPLLIEIKGGHIRDRDLVRFKGCRAEWQWMFDFELWQRKAGNWTQLQ